MKRTFDHFPKDATCPICKTNEDKVCFLLPKDWTQRDGICEAQPTHVDCMIDNEWAISVTGIIYRRTDR